jgi:ribonuclease G
MSKQILVNASHYETRVASLENGEIRSLHIEREEDKNVVGNVYLGLVKRVLPGMQAAFLELGLERTAFLYVDDIIDKPFGPEVDYLDEEEESSRDGEDEEEGEEGAEDNGEAKGEPKGEDEGEEGGTAGRGRAPRGRRAARSTAAPKRGRFQRRRPRGSANIQDLIKEGQEILVQVAKAPIGTKGARLTTHISLPGRNLVLMPTVKHLGISRRIENERERRRLRDMFTKRIRPRDVGFIIRTVAEDKSFRDLKADADYLIKTWARIKRDSKRKRAPAPIHEDLSLAMRAVRDFFTDEVDSFVIDNEEEYENVMRFISQFMPRLKSRVKLFKGPSQLFEHYGIEAEISRGLGKKVWLKSGGYLLIDQSEALTAVDVNTGRYVGSKSLEETILKTNLEAVKEIAYQLRIRNVGGIIIIDLIDMESAENREKVFKALQESLSEDKSKTNILKISELGLVEMTRKRTHEDLVRYLTEACTYCDGRGYHKSRRTICFEIFREIEKEAVSNTKNIVVFASPEVVTRMTNEEKKHVELLQKRFEKTIQVKPDPLFHIEQYEVFGKH